MTDMARRRPFDVGHRAIRRGPWPLTAVVRTLADGAVVAKRNLIKIKRVPDLLVWTLLSPIMFVLLFAYVFGNSIDIPGGVHYREFLIAGVFAQTVIFASTYTGSGLAEDMQKGIIDRFRSLPMSRSAVLVGRTVSDIATNVVSIGVMSLAGLAVGWRVRTSLVEALAGFALLLVFAYAFSWVMAYLGLVVGSPELVGNASFLVIFPLTFIANTFVPSENLPPVLQTIANWNPVSSVVQASRELFGNVDPSAALPATWSLQHPVAYTLIWVVLIITVFAPLAVHQYKRAASA